MNGDMSNNLACDLFQLAEENFDATNSLHQRKHKAAMSRANEILNYKPSTLSDVEELLNSWAVQMTKKV